MRTPFKRLFSLCLCLALVLALFPDSQAKAAESDQLKYLSYTISNGTVTITDCDNSIKGALVIPDTIEGLPVTAIGDRAFSLCFDLTQITLGNHVTTIDRYAFYRCKGLTGVTLGDHVSTIGEAAFYLTALTEITFPASVTYIGEESLNGISELKSVVFLGDPPQFHNRAFGKVIYGDNPFAGMDSSFAATVYYPIHNRKWTPNVLQDYGALHVDWVGIHSRDEGTLITPATCTTDGSRSYTCTICGEIETETIPAGHSWVITPIPPATCTTSGSYRYTCSECGDSKTETGNAPGHISDTGTITTQPTCTEPGQKVYTCTTCGELLKTETLPATGHQYQKGIWLTQPGCETTGEKSYTCGTCGYIKYVTWPANGHSEVTDPSVPPTCTATGLTEGKHCGTCQKVLEPQQVTPANGHSYSAVVEPPNCTRNGTMTSTCTVCGDTVIGTIPATGHQYETGTCIHCGITLTGDLTGDNTVDIADVARLYAHIRNTTPLEEPHLQNADTTGDGTVDIADVARLYAHVKGTIPL